MRELHAIGRWQLLDVLGRGGMGVVYLAEDRATGEQAALKTVRAADASLLSSIRREIHALARVRHPGIVRIIDEGVQDGLPWYAMELLRYPTLRRHVVSLREATAPASSTPTERLAPRPDDPR